MIINEEARIMTSLKLPIWEQNIIDSAVRILRRRATMLNNRAGEVEKRIHRIRLAQRGRNKEESR